MATTVYNDMEFIINHFRYHYDLFDELIYIDGAYQHFPHEHESGSSSDGTMETLFFLQDDLDPENKMSVIIPKVPWPTEMDKRTAHLKCGMPGDWFFVIDADEMAWGDFNRLRTHLATAPERFNVFSPMFIDYGREHLGGRAYPLDAFLLSLIRWVPGVHYCQNHWTLCFPLKDKKMVLGGPWWTKQKDFQEFVHLDFVGRKHFPRSVQKRELQKKEYYKVHHRQELIDPWKWPDEDWDNIDFGDGKHIEELLARRKGFKETKKVVEELGWDLEV